MLFYLLPAGVMFVIALCLFENDNTTPRSDIYSWIVLLLASALWPVTAVSMVRRAIWGPAACKSKISAAG